MDLLKILGNAVCAVMPVVEVTTTTSQRYSSHEFQTALNVFYRQPGVKLRDKYENRRMFRIKGRVMTSMRTTLRLMKEGPVPSTSRKRNPGSR